MQAAGFLPSAAALTAGYLSVVSGLLIAEVGLNSMCSLGGGGVSLVSLTERTLGPGGKWVATATYMFLHYALLVGMTTRHACNSCLVAACIMS